MIQIFKTKHPPCLAQSLPRSLKDLVDQVRAKQIPLTSRREQKPFFEEPPPRQVGGAARGTGGAEVPNCTQEDFETGRSSTGRTCHQTSSHQKQVPGKNSHARLPVVSSCKNSSTIQFLIIRTKQNNFNFGCTN